MAKNLFDAVIRSSAVARWLRNRWRFPQMQMATSTNIQIEGRILCGARCSIGQGSILIIPRKATLRLGDAVYVGRNVELGPRNTVEIGDSTSIQDRSLLVGEVRIGRYCLLSLNVLISSGRHFHDVVPHWLIRDQDAHAVVDDDLSKKSFQPVRVEDDCWLGVNTVVLPGITIGKGCIVGANSVVTRDLPPYVVAAGAPAHIVKSRLNFRPPKSINYSVETDLPYFYSGIGVSRAERMIAEPQGGLRGDCEFSISLNPAGAQSICLVARSNAEEPCVVRHAHCEQKLSREYQTLKFPIADPDTSRFVFEVPYHQNRWPVLVQKAWVE